MKRKCILCSVLLLISALIFANCSKSSDQSDKKNTSVPNSNTESNVTEKSLSFKVTQLADGLSALKYEGDCGFDEFLSNGGASSDAEVITYLTEKVLSGADGISFGKMDFGCSTISAKDENGNAIFGRNFDWEPCNAMIMHNVPKNEYASISTVNTDFISINGKPFSSLSDSAQAVICLYAPLDGMNEKGLAVSVNMLWDKDIISQNTDKPDITATTAIRLLLNKAATVDEAVSLLGQYDMHSSMGYMLHFAVADRYGNSVAVEYVNNEMIVTETPVVTNSYFAEGEKQGLGTKQSQERYNILMEALTEKKTMNMEDVRNALSSVGRKNFDDYKSTEWSAVFNQTTGEVHYYHRENYSKKFTFNIK